MRLKCQLWHLMHLIVSDIPDESFLLLFSFCLPVCFLHLFLCLFFEFASKVLILASHAPGCVRYPGQKVTVVVALFTRWCKKSTNWGVVQGQVNVKEVVKRNLAQN